MTMFRKKITNSPIFRPNGRFLTKWPHPKRGN